MRIRSFLLLMLLVILQLMGNNVASAVQTAGINLGMESLPPKKGGLWNVRKCSRHWKMQNDEKTAANFRGGLGNIGIVDEAKLRLCSLYESILY